MTPNQIGLVIDLVLLVALIVIIQVRNRRMRRNRNMSRMMQALEHHFNKRGGVR